MLEAGRAVATEGRADGFLADAGGLEASGMSRQSAHVAEVCEGQASRASPAHGMCELSEAWLGLRP